jgi:hypothetical protein
VAFLAVAVGGKGGGAYGVAGAAGHVSCFGYAVVCLFVIDGLARFVEDFGVAGFALVLYALIVLAVSKRDVAVLGQKQYGFGGDAGG